jgi:hypothetical protein
MPACSAHPNVLLSRLVPSVDEGPVQKAADIVVIHPAVQAVATECRPVVRRLGGGSVGVSEPRNRQAAVNMP